ncbi:MAG: hypothetical protein BWY43_00687 [candidate division WS2 bacterium ADurb.Bin280]|uniref:Uncharacterized protein n=1 Tax=candidate division WS2 bacterium ADurb.Bin280 TaxID=1852829 RepID=A0A1V5SBZ8_9BACT|nr:MAG: hypothetical protein BWY43_00687 [candidate division WS2 bacterium ADurb.Bin280]
MLVHVRLVCGNVVPVQLFESSIVFVRGIGGGAGSIAVNSHHLPVGEGFVCTPLIDRKPLNLGKDIGPGQFLAIILHDPSEPSYIEIGQVVVGSDRSITEPPIADPWDGHPPFLGESDHPLGEQVPDLVPGQQ